MNTRALGGTGFILTGWLVPPLARINLSGDFQCVSHRKTQ